MTYLWLKAFHVACVLLFVGGIFTTALTLSGLETPRDAARMAGLQRLRLWDRYVTGLALLALWGLGIAMAVQADWFAAPWLSVKLVVVIALSGLHGALTGNLRKAAADPARALPRYLRAVPALIAVSVAGVAVLAVAKPF